MSIYCPTLPFSKTSLCTVSSHPLLAIPAARQQNTRILAGQNIKMLRKLLGTVTRSPAFQADRFQWKANKIALFAHIGQFLKHPCFRAPISSFSTNFLYVQTSLIFVLAGRRSMFIEAHPTPNNNRFE